MKNIGDIGRMIMCALDELFVEVAGRRMFHVPSQTNLRAMYRFPWGPLRTYTKFGIDAPDEMTVEFGYGRTIRKLKRPPTIGDFFLDCMAMSWKVINIDRKDDLLRGPNRLVVTLQRWVVNHSEK